MVGSEGLEMSQQFGVALERLVQSNTSVVGGFCSYQADYSPIDPRDPLQPLQQQMSSEETGGSAQQHRSHATDWSRQRRSARECLGIDELVQSQICSVHFDGVTAMHRCETRPMDLPMDSLTEAAH